MKKNSGFTLLELIITLAVIGIVMAIGVPAMSTFTLNDRLTTQVNTLVGHLAYARSEAVKRTQPVSICISNDAATCAAAGNWGDGWIVYVDADNDNVYTAGVTGEDILRAQQTLEGGNTLTATGIGTQITYDYRGFATATSVGSFLLCDHRSGPEGKTVTISTTGRVSSKAHSTCP